MVLAFASAKVPVDVLRDAVGVAVRVLMLLVASVVVHNMHGVPFGMGMNVNVRRLVRARFLRDVA